MADIGEAAIDHDLHAIAAATLVATADEFDVVAGDGMHGWLPDHCSGCAQDTLPGTDPRPRHDSIGISDRVGCSAGEGTRSPPAPVQPQPLVGMLAHPALDHRGNRLHGAAHVDFALRIAPRLDRLGEVDTKAMAIGQAHHARSMNWALDMA